VTDSREFPAYLPMALALQERFHIRYLCTDHYPVYAQFRIAEHHLQTKAETSLVESKNALVRHFLARFNRRSLRHSKAFDMIEAALLLLFKHKGLLLV
jgi:insertion element IS1 protein InsB